MFEVYKDRNILQFAQFFVSQSHLEDDGSDAPACYTGGSFRVNSTNGSQVTISNITQKIPKITLISIMKACKILDCKVL